HIFNRAMEALEVGTTGNIYQEMTCDFFEERGHPTIRTAPGIEQGYVHSLGHGLGLQIHSRARLSAVSPAVIKPRQALTIEPGLHYPARGYGGRVGDTGFIAVSGEVHPLTPFPKDLVIEVGWPPLVIFAMWRVEVGAQHAAPLRLVKIFKAYCY